MTHAVSRSALPGSDSFRPSVILPEEKASSLEASRRTMDSNNFNHSMSFNPVSTSVNHVYLLPIIGLTGVLGVL